MIRKVLMASAIAVLPVAAVTTVGLSGVASAAKGPILAISCTESGTVTFPKPGLSNQGTLTKKTSEKSKTVVTPAASEAGCGTKSLKVMVTSATTPCTSDANAATDACQNVTPKDPNIYDSATGFAGGSTITDLEAALAAKPPKFQDNKNNLVLDFNSSNGYDTASEVLPGGACGSGVGYDIKGHTSNAAWNYEDLVCLTTDSGTGTSGSFLADIAAESAGNTSIVIASAAIGGSSALTISAA